MSAFFLIHGGLWEPMDARTFWTRTGLVAGLETAGHSVVAPDRLAQPPDWAADTAFLARALPSEPVFVVGGSNGCTPAVLLALEHRASVRSLVLGWPATCGDPHIDAHSERSLADQGADPGTIAALLNGQTLRGVTDAQLASLALPVAVLPSAPANPFHQRDTVDSLLRLIPGAIELPGSPEPPRPDFARLLPTVLEALAWAARS